MVVRYLWGRSDFLMLQVINVAIFGIYRNQPIFTYFAFDISIIMAQLLIILFTCYQCYRSYVADIKREDNINKWQKIKSKLEEVEK